MFASNSEDLVLASLPACSTKCLTETGSQEREHQCLVEGLVNRKKDLALNLICR